jgi:hypothetical protein
MIAATSPRGQVAGLRLARPLQRTLNRGQGGRGMDQRDAAQGEPVRQKASEDVGAHLAFACARFGLDDPEQTGRRARAVPCVLQEHEVLRLAQIDLDGQGAGRCHRAADDNTRRGARQPGEGT